MFSNRTEYAIRALRELAGTTNLLRSEDIATRQHIPPKFLPHILSDLARAGLVKAARGYGGGVILSRKPAEITFKSVVEAVQGPLTAYDCLAGLPHCEMAKDCTLQPIWRRVQTAIDAILLSTTLEDLIAQERSEA
jgi:Rrf2 family protein